MTTEKSSNARILSGFLWVSLFLFLGKIAGAAKEMAVAWRYGVSPIVDAYVFVFNMLSWPGGILGGALLALLPPLFARWKRENPIAFFLFQKELFGCILCIGIVLTFFTPIILWMLIYFEWIGQSIEQQKQFINMIFPLSGIIFSGVLISFLSTWVLAEGKQIGTLLEGVPSFIICIFLILFNVASACPIIMGTILGFLLQLIFLFLIVRSRYEIYPMFQFKSPAWSDFFKVFWILIFSQFASTLISVIDIFAASYIENGGVSVLNYANRVLMLVMSFGGIAINRSVLPVFSQSHPRVLGALAARWTGWMFCIGVLFVVVGWFTAPWVISFIFERGQFDASSSIVVADVFRYGLMQLPFYFSWMVLVAQVNALWGFRSLAIIFWIGVPLKLLLVFLLCPRFGLLGVQISSTLIYMFLAIFLWILMRKKYSVVNMENI